MSTVSCKNIFLALRQNQISRFLEFYCLISYFFSKYFEQICRYIELVIIWLNWIYHSFESKVQYVFCVFFGSKPFYMCCNFLIKNFFILLIEWYHTAQKMKFSSKDFFSKYDQTRSFPRTTFTEDFLNGKLHFLCRAWPEQDIKQIFRTKFLTYKFDFSKLNFKHSRLSFMSNTSSLDIAFWYSFIEMFSVRVIKVCLINFQFFPIQFWRVLKYKSHISRLFC